MAAVEHGSTGVHDRFAVELVVIDEEEHEVGRLQRVGAAVRARHPSRELAVVDVGVDDVHPGAEPDEELANRHGRRLPGVAGVRLVGQAEDEDP